ncbi:unnamed protein product [Lathyrus sativus]|nr:unnamed protein product [Lathyrus sativus]
MLHLDLFLILMLLREFQWTRVAATPKPVQNKVTAKPKFVEVIDIISSEEESIKEKFVHTRKEREVNFKKKSSHTLTSVLTARSKASCGLTNKPKEIVDIDAADANNELVVVEYLDDIYKFYKLVWNESRPHDYMDSQPEINDKMRAIFINCVHCKHNLRLTIR